MSTPLKKGIEYTDLELINARHRSYFYDGPLRVYNVTFGRTDENFVSSETFVAHSAAEARIIADEYSFRGMGDHAPLGRVLKVEWMRIYS